MSMLMETNRAVEVVRDCLFIHFVLSKALEGWWERDTTHGHTSSMYANRNFKFQAEARLDDVMLQGAS